MNRKQRVLRMMLDGEWHKTVEIEQVEVGGSQGTRRLRELRDDGWDIESRKVPVSNQWEYRLRGVWSDEVFTPVEVVRTGKIYKS